MKRHNKYVIFNIKNKTTWQEVYENEKWCDYKIKLNKWQLIKAILFEKGFLWKLGETIKYALIHLDFYRGTNASDVVLFIGTKNFNKIWKEEK